VLCGLKCATQQATKDVPDRSQASCSRSFRPSRYTCTTLDRLILSSSSLIRTTACVHTTASQEQETSRHHTIDRNLTHTRHLPAAWSSANDCSTHAAARSDQLPLRSLSLHPLLERGQVIRSTHGTVDSRLMVSAESKAWNLHLSPFLLCSHASRLPTQRQHVHQEQWFVTRTNSTMLSLQLVLHTVPDMDSLPSNIDNPAGRL
jgi:hypothetical protein